MSSTTRIGLLTLLLTFVITGCASIGDRLHQKVELENTQEGIHRRQSTLSVLIKSDQRYKDEEPRNASNDLLNKEIEKVLTESKWFRSVTIQDLSLTNYVTKQMDISNLDDFHKVPEAPNADYLLEIHFRQYRASENIPMDMLCILTIGLLPGKEVHSGKIGVRLTRKSDNKTTEIILDEIFTIYYGWLVPAFGTSTGSINSTEYEPLANLVSVALEEFRKQGLFE